MNIVVDGLAVHIKQKGKGRKTALLLHGWGSDASTFDGLALPGYRLIAPDLPGFGGTEAPPEPWDVGRYADFVVKLSKKLEIKVDALIGHSFGGRIALDLSGKRKLACQHLVLIASHGLPEPITPKARVLYGLRIVGRFFPARIRAKVASRIGSSDLKASRGVMRETLKLVIAQDATDDAQYIEQPTLLIYGQQDDITPVAFGEQFERLIPEAVLDVIPEAGHYVHLDQTKYVNDSIGAFLV